MKGSSTPPSSLNGGDGVQPCVLVNLHTPCRPRILATLEQPRGPPNLDPVGGLSLGQNRPSCCFSFAKLWPNEFSHDWKSQDIKFQRVLEQLLSGSLPGRSSYIENVLPEKLKGVYSR